MATGARSDARVMLRRALMLVDEIRSRMKAAMKARNDIEKEVLRVCLGEITTHEARDGKSMSDEDVHRILRKLAKSNRETLKLTTQPEEQRKLRIELEVLESMLPQALNEQQVTAALAPVVADIKACGNDGQATGIAMRHLKGQGAVVEGRTVSAVVRSLRA
ncbi:MAG TPA: hypothetical protein ENK23_06290 [Sorangium sp.]|nr:hypothetical protein [Sorangium sp.]